MEWHEVKIFQIGGGGFAFCNTFHQEGTVPRVFQKKENELCQGQ